MSLPAFPTSAVTCIYAERQRFPTPHGCSPRPTSLSLVVAPARIHQTINWAMGETFPAQSSNGVKDMRRRLEIGAEQGPVENAFGCRNQLITRFELSGDLGHQRQA